MSLEAKKVNTVFTAATGSSSSFFVYFFTARITLFFTQSDCISGLRWLGLAISGARVGNESEEALIHFTALTGRQEFFFSYTVQHFLLSTPYGCISGPTSGGPNVQQCKAEPMRYRLRPWFFLPIHGGATVFHGKLTVAFLFTSLTDHWVPRWIGPPRSEICLERDSVHCALNSPRCTLAAIDSVSDGALKFGRRGQLRWWASESA
jgi:hypothetical protein